MTEASPDFPPVSSPGRDAAAAASLALDADIGLDGARGCSSLHPMRLPVAFALLALAGTQDGARAAPHRYTPAERYAGCMFGETIPLMRRGTERERALAIASDRCIAWSEGLSAADIREVDLELHRAIERSERQGL